MMRVSSTAEEQTAGVIPASMWPIVYLLGGLVGCTVWGICFYRALVFHGTAMAAYRHSESLDAATDYQLSEVFLYCYLASFLISVGLLWLMKRTKQLQLAFHNLVWLLVALSLVWAKPEEPIVHLPSLAPVGGMLIILLTGLDGLHVSRIGSRKVFMSLAVVAAVAVCLIWRYIWPWLVHLGMVLVFSWPPLAQPLPTLVGWLKATVLAVLSARILFRLFHSEEVVTDSDVSLRVT